MDLSKNAHTQSRASSKTHQPRNKFINAAHIATHVQTGSYASLEVTAHALPIKSNVSLTQHVESVRASASDAEEGGGVQTQLLNI